ncbi:hypothetical protein Tco_0663525 [Tanacetum coccineum]
MVANLTLIITKQLDPPHLVHIQLFLVENMLKDLVVRVDDTLRAIQLSRCIGDYLASLHEHTTYSLIRCIAVNYKIFNSVW